MLTSKINALVIGICLSLQFSGASANATSPTPAELMAAVQHDRLAEYATATTAWLNEQIGTAAVTDARLLELLKKPDVAAALAQRQFIAKVGAPELGKFAAAQPENKAFVSWLLANTAALELYSEGIVPIGLAAREENKYRASLASLEIWQKIFQADPDSREGFNLKLAIATAIGPPGSGAPGAGQVHPAVEPLERYRYFKQARQNKELFPSFDKLTVWELTKVVSSGASNEDLTWAREMVNTWRPDLREDEMVVNSTSFVWRRNSPHPYTNYKTVLSGGGKCGPRSSWSVMVCQAFGIPAIGVGQPAHACVAYKAANPLTEPQPGNVWKVGYGRGWDVSKLEGMSGPEFVAGVQERADTVRFSQVERLRWLAVCVPDAERSKSILSVAHTIQKATPKTSADLTASLKPEEAEADPGKQPATAAKPPATATKTTPPTAPGPLKAESGKFHVDAANFAQTGGKISWGGQSPHVLVHDSYAGGKQIFFQQQMKEQWADYVLDLPAAGTYALTMKAACVNDDQLLEVVIGDQVVARVPIALGYGTWQETAPVEIRLAQGVQKLRIQTPVSVEAENHKRGIALRSFELQAK